MLACDDDDDCRDSRDDQCPMTVTVNAAMNDSHYFYYDHSCHYYY